MSLLGEHGPAREGVPFLQTVAQGCMDVDSGVAACGRHRLHMQLRLPAPGFYGAMNFSGDLRAWSFTNMTWPNQTREVSRIVRFAGSEGSGLWSFWVLHPTNMI